MMVGSTTSGMVRSRRHSRCATRTARSPQCDVMGAWLLVGPPDFAPPLPQVVTLYDVLLDMAARRLTIPHDESVYQTGELARLAAFAADLHADGAGVAPVQQLSTYQVAFDT